MEGVPFQGNAKKMRNTEKAEEAFRLQRSKGKERGAKCTVQQDTQTESCNNFTVYFIFLENNLCEDEHIWRIKLQMCAANRIRNEDW